MVVAVVLLTVAPLRVAQVQRYVDVQKPVLRDLAQHSQRRATARPALTCMQLRGVIEVCSACCTASAAASCLFFTPTLTPPAPTGRAGHH